MQAVYAIIIFIVAMFAINRYEYGRFEMCGKMAGHARKRGSGN